MICLNSFFCLINLKVLDPVGVSPVLKFRSEFVQNLLKQHKPTIIRGNAAEIVALNNQLHQKQEGRTSSIADFSASRGPDSKLKSTEHVQAAESLSRLLTGYGKSVCSKNISLSQIDNRYDW